MDSGLAADELGYRIRHQCRLLQTDRMTGMVELAVQAFLGGEQSVERAAHMRRRRNAILQTDENRSGYRHFCGIFHKTTDREEARGLVVTGPPHCRHSLLHGL